MTEAIFEDVYFLKESIVDINAAVVGFSKSRWVSIDENKANEENALKIMKKYRFDVLPIIKGSEVKKYYQTKTWNDYSSILQKSIMRKDIIPFQTNIRDVIKGFALESRLFYFLSSEHRIVGLISVVNLNCRQVKVYLFSLLSELEICLGNFIADNIPEGEIIKMTFGETDKEKHKNVKARFKSDKAKGFEVPFVEYLYLSDLINIVIKKNLYSMIGYTRDSFKKSFGSLNDLRHDVAHPARSLVTSENSAEKIWNRIDRIEEALFRLR